MKYTTIERVERYEPPTLTANPAKDTDGKAIDRDNLLKLAIQAWGEPAQMLMAIEEMSELTKELCKAFRADDEKMPAVREHIVEEIADCKIMLRQMELIFGAADDWEQMKLQRLEDQLNASLVKHGEPQ